MAVTPHLMALAALSAFGAAQAAPAPDWRYLGTYSNVKTSDESGDCDGFQLQLWKTGGGKSATVAGTFTWLDGPCVKAAQPLYRVAYNGASGALSFAVPGADATAPETVTFSGRLRGDELSGLLKIANHLHPEGSLTERVTLLQQAAVK